MMTETNVFLTKLVYEDISVSANKFSIVLTTDFVYNDPVYGKITAPMGFVSDLASIPQLFQNIISKVGVYDSAAVIHDWIYSVQTLSRDACDNVFLRAMKASGVGFFKRYAMFWGVRGFAFLAWKRASKDVDTYRNMIK